MENGPSKASYLYQRIATNLGVDTTPAWRIVKLFLKKTNLAVFFTLFWKILLSTKEIQVTEANTPDGSVQQRCLLMRWEQYVECLN